MHKGEGGSREHTSRDTLNTTTTRETTDGGFRDALDVVSEDFTVTFGAAFAEAFATFSACGGCVSLCWKLNSRKGEWMVKETGTMERAGGEGRTVTGGEGVLVVYLGRMMQPSDDEY